MTLDPQYRAPLRDPTDLIVLQTAEQGEADDVLCTLDSDFYDQVALLYCAARGIEVCDEFTLLQTIRLGDPTRHPVISPVFASGRSSAGTRLLSRQALIEVLAKESASASGVEYF